MTAQTTGQKLKQLRKQRKVMQYQVAADLGMSQQLYSAYETDQVDFPLSKLRRLAAYYGVPVDELLPGHEEAPVHV